MSEVAYLLLQSIRSRHVDSIWSTRREHLLLSTTQKRSLVYLDGQLFLWSVNIHREYAMKTIRILPCILTTLLTFLCQSACGDYVVVVSQTTQKNPKWQKVVETLVKKHCAKTLTFQKSVTEVKNALAEAHPRHTCFVAQPSEANKAFVMNVHQLTRGLDRDPYTDTFWGILTGFNADNALEIAKRSKPLTIRKVAAATEIAMEMVEEGKWYCELKKNRMVEKKQGGKPVEQKGPGDTTQALADTLSKYQADLFITSGHACEKNWQIGFRYRNGYFFSKDGKLFGRDTKQRVFPITSDHTRVYLPIGNCSMGNIKGKDCMALAWMNSASVHQMVAYVVPTWFGYAGWGCLDYFVEQPGRYSLNQAFFANQHALIHSLENRIGNQRGLRYDRDVVAFYGDPAWQAKMAKRQTAYKQSLSVKDGIYTLTIKGNRGQESFKPINTNGSQRGWRPIVQFLPHRIRNVKILDDNKLSPVVTDDFILVPNPRTYDSGKMYQIRFSATAIR